MLKRNISLSLAGAFAIVSDVARPQSVWSSGTVSQETIIPTPFQGEWRTDLKACPPVISDTIEWIGAKRMRFDHSVGEVRQVIVHNEKSITLFASFLSEGDPWDGKLRMTLSPSGNELTIDFGQGGRKRYRCPE